MIYVLVLPLFPVLQISNCLLRNEGTNIMPYLVTEQRGMEHQCIFIFVKMMAEVGRHVIVTDGMVISMLYDAVGTNKKVKCF